MKKIRVLFYRPKRDGHVVDNLIGGWTGALNTIGLTWKFKGNLLKARRIVEVFMCSHMELETPNKNGNFELQEVDDAFDPTGEWVQVGKCWTSTMGPLGGKNRTGSGVCVRPASVILSHPKRWFYAEFEIPDGAYGMLTRVMQESVDNNKGYDIGLLLSFIGVRWFAAPDKYICSEFTDEHLLYALDSAVLWKEHDPKLVIKEEQFKQIINTLKITMSPLLSAITLHFAGVKFYEVSTGEEILI